MTNIVMHLALPHSLVLSRLNKGMFARTSGRHQETAGEAGRMGAVYPSQKSVSEILDAPAAEWNAPAENGQGVKRMGGKDRASWSLSDPQPTSRSFLWA